MTTSMDPSQGVTPYCNSYRGPSIITFTRRGSG